MTAKSAKFDSKYLLTPGALFDYRKFIYIVNCLDLQMFSVLVFVSQLPLSL